jgi:hypothetical protein
MSEYRVMRHLCNLETVRTYEGTDHMSPGDRNHGL